MYCPVDWFRGDTRESAQLLLGQLLVVRERDGGEVAGRIVETEAYLADDPASHSFRGPTPRSATMFGPPGHAYIYRSYGIHWCFNVVCRPTGIGEAILVRALEPVTGIDRMRARRGGVAAVALTNGPGKLTAALGLSGSDDGTPLDGSARIALVRTARAVDPATIVATRRIGISRATDRLWRFVLTDNRWVGSPRPKPGWRGQKRPQPGWRPG